MKRIAFHAALLLALGAASAEAHLVTTGLGPLYDGAGHFALSPEEWVSVAALALLAGLNGPPAGRLLLFTLPAAWLAGGALGLACPASPSFAWTAAGLIAAGGLVAADWRPARPWVAGLGALLGLWHGYLNGAALAPTGEAALPLLGAAALVFALVALLAGLVVRVRAYWQRIAVRIAGSWIAATGLLLAAWALRKSG